MRPSSLHSLTMTRQATIFIILVAARCVHEQAEEVEGERRANISHCI